MAPKKTVKVQKGKDVMPLFNTIVVNSKRLASQDIKKWQDAVNAARNALNPMRRQLYELYDSLLLDGHLQAVRSQRESAITNKKVLFRMKEEGVETPEWITEYITEAPWMYDLLKYSQEARTFGHSLIELIPENGIISKAELINRANVVPEKGLMLWNYQNWMDGLLYRTDPARKDYFVEIGGANDYGLLMLCAQYIIYKRGGFGDWAQFAELFGMPFREAKYNPFDANSRELLQTALEETGAAGYAIIPEGTSMTFHDNNASGKSEVFKDLVVISNEEISKAYLGATMMVDDGASKSQGQVHQDVAEGLSLSDLIETEHMLNWQLKDKLISFYGPNELSKGMFKLDCSFELPVEKRIIIDMQVSQKIPFPDDYWYKTYGIPKPDGTAKPIPADPKEEEEDDDEPTPEPGKKKSPENSLTHPCCSYEHNSLHHLPVGEVPLTPEEEELINIVASNKAKGKPFLYDPAYQKAVKKVVSGLKEGLNPSFGYDKEDQKVYTMMEINLFKFGYNRSLAQVVELNQALKSAENVNAFRAKAAGIMGSYSKALDAEFDFSRAVGQESAKWIDFKEEQNLFPYWQYVTAGDDRVRPAHAALNGMIFKVSDSQAAALSPPNGYGCRCTKKQLSASEVSKKDIKKLGDATGVLGEEWEHMKKGGFAVNRAEIKEVFNLNKVYAEQLDGISTDFNKLNYADFDLKPLSEIKSSGEIPAATAKKQKTYVDYAGRELAMKAKTLLVDVAEALKAPDEVWLKSKSGEQYTYNYIKHYKGKSVTVTVEVKDGVMNITDAAIVNDDLARTGLLTKK